MLINISCFNVLIFISICSYSIIGITSVGAEKRDWRSMSSTATNKIPTTKRTTTQTPTAEEYEYYDEDEETLTSVTVKAPTAIAPDPSDTPKSIIGTSTVDTFTIETPVTEPGSGENADSDDDDDDDTSTDIVITKEVMTKEIWTKEIISRSKSGATEIYIVSTDESANIDAATYNSMAQTSTDVPPKKSFADVGPDTGDVDPKSLAASNDINNSANEDDDDDDDDDDDGDGDDYGEDGDEYVDFDIDEQEEEGKEDGGGGKGLSGVNIPILDDTTTTSPEEQAAEDQSVIDLFNENVIDLDSYRKAVQSYYNPAPYENDEKYENDIKHGIFQPELSILNVLTFDLVQLGKVGVDLIAEKIEDEKQLKMYVISMFQPILALLKRANKAAGIKKQTYWFDIVTTILSGVLKPHSSASWTKFKKSINQTWEKENAKIG